MLQLSSIEHMAGVREFETQREISRLCTLRKRHSDSGRSKRSHLELNLRVVLQPRFSFSFWVGKGV
jgi:hypothetical protein